MARTTKICILTVYHMSLGLSVMTWCIIDCWYTDTPALDASPYFGHCKDRAPHISHIELTPDNFVKALP